MQNARGSMTGELLPPNRQRRDLHKQRGKPVPAEREKELDVLKKVVCFLACALLAAGFAGCSADAGPANKDPEGAGSNSPSENTASAKADGFGGEITVTLTVENGAITGCLVDAPDETEGIGTNAVKKIPESILQANSVEVDAVAGCTVTSNAILKAALEAYDQIGGKS